MIISHSRKFIFIHIYKCAGSAMSIALPDDNDESIHQNVAIPYHFTAKEIQNEIENGDIYPALTYNRNAWSDYYKFAFVRNPYDWAVSLYFWLRENQSHDMNGFCNSITFSEFVDYLYYPNDLVFNDGSSEAYCRPLKTFVIDANDNQIDFIGRFENVDNDYNRVCNHLNISNTLTKTNTSNHLSFSQYYTTDIQNKILELYKEDFDFFGYSREIA